MAVAHRAMQRVQRQLGSSVFRGAGVALNRRTVRCIPPEAYALLGCRIDSTAWMQTARAFGTQMTPSFGAESITEGTILEWKVKVGDAVQKGDLLCSIETDKVTVEAQAEESGTIQEIHLNEGDNAEVGKPLVTIGEGAPTSAPAPSAGDSAPAAAAPAASSGEIVEVVTPDFGAESITEGTVMAWQVKVGQPVAKGTVLVGIETDKVTVDVVAPDDGAVTEILLEEETTAKKDQLVCKFQKGAAPSASAAAPAPAPAPAPAAAKAPAPAPAPASTAAAAAAPTAGGREQRAVKMTRMRQAIARRLKDAQNTTAMLTTFQEVDMGAIMQLRKEYKDLFEQQHGVKLGFMSAFCKASAFALQQIPSVNAVIDDATQEIIYRDYIDISVAVASPRGLVVPVVRNVEGMSLHEIEKGIGELALKAKKEELTLDDMSGGTFTISNGGIFGSMMGTPIINPPQSAILGMHATKQRPVVLKNGEIGVRPIMYLALTYDHRMIDGREAVTFLCIVRDQIEDPRRLLLSL